jgi:hypothetical protein
VGLGSEFGIRISDPDGADVGMIQGRSCFGFMNEAPLFVLGLAEMGRQKFKSDKTVKLRVLGLKTAPIPPSPSLSRNL